MANSLPFNPTLRNRVSRFRRQSHLMHFHIPRNVTEIQENYFVKAFTETTKNFCRETSLHGVKHIVGQKDDIGSRNITLMISKFIWSAACTAGAIFAIAMMGLVWDRFQTTPTITTVESTSHPVWQVPFPGVTICNINKVYSPNAKNITNILLENGIERSAIHEFLENLSNLINPEYIDALYINTYTILEKMGYDTEKLMVELAQPCESLLKLCFWLGNNVPCDSIFRIAKSSEGFCCSFNYKALRESLEVDQVPSNEKLSAPVYRVSGSGQFVGLNVLLDVEKDSYVAMTKSFYGVEVIIHDADEFPQASLTSAIAQPGQEVIMSITPSVVLCRPAVRGIDLVKRQCYFDDEMKLRSAKKYSLNSCITECRVDTIVAKCNCLPFFYPDVHNPAFANKVRICNLHDVACLRTHRDIFSNLQPPEGLGFNTSQQIGMDCVCLPSCTDQQYQVSTISATRLNTHIKSPLFGNMDLTNLTTIQVYFKDLTCIRYRKDTYMTWDGLFASFGGIFGLCLGGSVLSLVEMLYYFTIKLCFTVMAYKKNTHPILPINNVHSEHNKRAAKMRGASKWNVVHRTSKMNKIGIEQSQFSEVGPFKWQN